MPRLNRRFAGALPPLMHAWYPYMLGTPPRGPDLRRGCRESDVHLGRLDPHPAGRRRHVVLTGLDFDHFHFLRIYRSILPYARCSPACQPHADRRVQPLLPRPLPPSLPPMVCPVHGFRNVVLLVRRYIHRRLSGFGPLLSLLSLLLLLRSSLFCSRSDESPHLFSRTLSRSHGSSCLYARVERGGPGANNHAGLLCMKGQGRAC